MSHVALSDLTAFAPLRGQIVSLHVMTADDWRELSVTCLDPEIWRSTIAKPATADDLRRYLQLGLDAMRDGRAVPMMIRLADSGTAVGSTRLAAHPDPGAVEIGWTFIAPAWHRGGVNAEAKLLLLDHCLARGRCRRVVFKASADNLRSKAALAKLGAAPPTSGPLTDLVAGRLVEWFEITSADWPDRRRALAARVDRARAAGD